MSKLRTKLKTKMAQQMELSESHSVEPKLKKRLTEKKPRKVEPKPKQWEDTLSEGEVCKSISHLISIS